MNTREIALPGDEWKKRVYFHHAGRPGSDTWTLAWELHSQNPTMVRFICICKMFYLGSSFYLLNIFLQPMKCLIRLPLN